MADKLTEEQLVAAIEAHEASADSGDLTSDRITARERYLGDPLGNEVEGRSQVVSRISWDTVEWLKPQLADIFTSGEEIVKFSPRSKEDVKGSEQETDYVTYMITQKNNWFEIWYNWTHDALTERVGYVMAYWDDFEDQECEKYHGLTDDEWANLQQDQDVEFKEHVVGKLEVQTPLGPIAINTHDVEAYRKKPRNIVRVDNIAPENIKVDANARGLSLQDPRVAFVEHEEMKTISDLRTEGFDVDDDISDGGTGRNEWETANRNHNIFAVTDMPSDPSMRRVRARHVWIRCDYDGDGKAELRDVVIVGTTILQNEDCSTIPVVALCPIPLPHKHHGLSVIDAVMDLELIQTALLRGALDNQYLANNGRYAINDNVNLDDMLDSRPGGVVRVEGKNDPRASIGELAHPTTGANTVPMMEYVDRIGQKRTGVNEQTQGIDANALNQTATKATIMMTASQQRIKFIARIFAETGVKSLFQLVHELTLKNSRQQELVELRGEWVPINPRQWTKRTDMVLSVALGTGDRPAQLAYLAQQRQMQLEMLPLGITNPDNIYATMVRMTKAAGYKNEDEFWNNPKGKPLPPPPQDPAIQIAQMKQQGDAQKFQAESMLAERQGQMERDAKQRESQMQLELQASNDARDQERQREQAAMDFQLEQAKLVNEAQQAELDRQHKERIAAAQLEVDRYKADLAAQTTLQAAAATRQTALETAAMSSETTKQTAELSAKTTKETAQLSADTTKETAKEAKKPDEKHAKEIGDLKAQVKELTGPKKLIRGEDGKASGISINGRVIPIKRGADGRIEGI